MTEQGNTSATEQEIKMAARDLAAYFRAQARLDKYGHTSNVVEILEHADQHAPVGYVGPENRRTEEDRHYRRTG